MGMVYFDNAATTYPKPRRVREAVTQAIESYGANPGRSGHKMSLDTAVKVYEARETVADFFGAENVEDVVFTSNCTHAINFAIKGLVKPGDHIIISDLEHNSVLRPVHALSTKGIVSYSVARVIDGDDDATVEEFRRLIRPNTRLIACTHASNVWGIRLPIKKLGILAQQYDLLFLVDAAQTAGLIPIDIQRLGIDFLCAPGHKSLYGPPGTGILVTPLGAALDCCFEGGTGNRSSEFEQPPDMPERLESGTINTCGVIGLGEGVRYVSEKGVTSTYNESIKLSAEIYDGLSQLRKVKLYTNGFVTGRHLPVISFNIDGMASEEVTARLSDMGFATRAGLHCAPLAHTKMGTLETGAVRVSVGSFNTKAQGKQLLSAVYKLCK